MSVVFVSYDRQSRALAETLAEDIHVLGHTVWLDRELTGGQPWWERILESIRACDVFICILTPRSLDSTACQREYGYASALGKPVLPVLVAEGVSTNLLPPPLAELQYVDYRSLDKAAALRLARALDALPPKKPLPEPLPAAPEVPSSYLGGLAQRLSASAFISIEEQSALLLDLKRSLRDPETAEDGRNLLKQFRKRRDLLAAIADEIDELLQPAVPALRQQSPRDVYPPPVATAAAPFIPTPPPSASQGVRAPTARQRLLGALVGFVTGTIVGVLAVGVTAESGVWFFGLISGPGWAVAGAVAGNRRTVIVNALAGAVVGWFVFSLMAYRDAFAGGAVFGAPLGAIVGAIAGVIYLRVRRPGAGVAKAAAGQ